MDEVSLYDCGYSTSSPSPVMSTIHTPSTLTPKPNPDLASLSEAPNPLPLLALPPSDLNFLLSCR